MDGAARKAWLKMTLKNREIFFCVCCCCCCCSFCSSFFIYFVCCISIHVDLQLFWNKYFDYSRFGISRKVRQESIQLTIQRRFDFNGLSRALVFRFYFLFSFSELLTAFPPPPSPPIVTVKTMMKSITDRQMVSGMGMRVLPGTSRGLPLL